MCKHFFQAYLNVKQTKIVEMSVENKKLFRIVQALSFFLVISLLFIVPRVEAKGAPESFRIPISEENGPLWQARQQA